MQQVSLIPGLYPFLFVYKYFSLPNLPPLPHPSYTTLWYFLRIKLLKSGQPVAHFLCSAIGGEDHETVIVFEFL